MKMSKEEQERHQMSYENLLYNIGYENAKRIIAEAEQVAAEYAHVEVPESLDRRINALIDQREREYKARQRRQAWRRGSRRLIAACLILLMVGAALTSGVEAFRIRLLNVFVDVRENFSAIFYRESGGVVSVDMIPDGAFYPTYIPRGYELSDVVGEGAMIKLLITDGLGNAIHFTQTRLPTNTHIDTEGARTWDVEIDGFEGLVAVKADTTVLLWRNDSWEFLLSGAADKNEMLEIAESLVRKE